jgi:hypothetical protein
MTCHYARVFLSRRPAAGTWFIARRLDALALALNIQLREALDAHAILAASARFTRSLRAGRGSEFTVGIRLEDLLRDERSLCELALQALAEGDTLTALGEDDWTLQREVASQEL